MSRKLSPFVLRLMAALASLIVAPGARLAATDFLRGDANSDGVVSLADVQFIGNWVFRAGSWPECHDAANANSDSKVNIADAIWIVNFLFRGGPVMEEPFPAPGPAAPWDSGICASYGHGAPLDDPAASIEILDATAAGGGSDTARIVLGVSSSTSLGAYSGGIRFPSGLLGGSGSARDLSGKLSEFGAAGVSFAWEHVSFFFIASFTEPSGEWWIPADQGVAVLEITACLKKGTSAGVYPLALEAGELVDAASGRAIQPALGSATLVVLADVDPASPCASDPPPPPPEVNLAYQLEDATAPPGGTAAVPFIIRADAEVQGYAFSVDFDEEVLSATRVEEVWQKPDGSSYGFAKYEINNAGAVPGNAGVDEGFIVGAAVFAFSSSAVMPSNADNEALRFHLLVHPNTPAFLTELRFIDGGRGTGSRVANRVTAYGVSYTPDMANSFVFLSGVVHIRPVLPDGTLFIRGDTNGDAAVDISDPQATLSHLFLGGERPRCYDAADANDDGRLDVSDPVATLGWLFLGASPLPPPGGTPGSDPTQDGLSCAGRP